MFILLLIPFLWVIYRWAVDSFPPLARRRLTVASALGALVAVQLATRFLVVHGHDSRAGQVHMVASGLIMALAIAAGPIALMRVVAWATLRAHSKRPVSIEAMQPPVVTRRQLVEATGGSVLLAATGSMLGWGMVRGRHAFELREVPVAIPGLPRVLDGYVIAQVSDLHVGNFVRERELDEGLARAREARADLVVVTGDIVDFDPAFAPLVARKLGDLAPRDGVAAILGNHDYYTGADAVLAALRAAGVAALVDEGRLLRAGDGGGFALLGIDDEMGRRVGRGTGLDRALAMVPAAVPRICLSHRPSTVDLWAGRVALQLSGHTHGGQINPGFSPAAMLLHYVSGRYAVGGTTLYVNRGFGTAGPPSRVGAPPEVTRIVLVAA